MKMRKLIIIASLTILLSACNKTPLNQEDLVILAMTDGKWAVTIFTLLTGLNIIKIKPLTPLITVLLKTQEPGMGIPQPGRHQQILQEPSTL